MRFRRGVFTLVFAGLLASSGCEQIEARRSVQEGNKLYYAGKYEKAIARYEEALKARPELTIGWYNLALTHLALFSAGLKSAENEAHARGAIEGFQRYLKAYPDDTQTRDYLLSTYIDSGHYEGALAYFEEKLAADPNDIQAVAQLAQINGQNGKYAEAIRWYMKRADMERSADGKADSYLAIGVLDWRRLNNHAEVAGEERARIADEGLGALAMADELRGDHASTVTYMNLLYRERALAHDAWYARAVDLATAQQFMNRAMTLAKAEQERAAREAVAPPKGDTAAAGPR